MGMGTLLEKARLEQGLSIQEMSERTKIKPQFLQAIEEEAYDQLPGEAYVKPFLRTYARALGLEEQIMVELTSQSAVSDEMMISIRARRERVRRARRMRFAVRSSLILVVLAGAAYLIFRLMNG